MVSSSKKCNLPSDKNKVSSSNIIRPLSDAPELEVCRRNITGSCDIGCERQEETVEMDSLVGTAAVTIQIVATCDVAWARAAAPELFDFLDPSDVACFLCANTHALSLRSSSAYSNWARKRVCIVVRAPDSISVTQNVQLAAMLLTANVVGFVRCYKWTLSSLLHTALQSGKQAPQKKTVIADTNVSRIDLSRKNWLLTRSGYSQWLAYAAPPRFSYVRVSAQLGERGVVTQLCSTHEVDAALDAGTAVDRNEVKFSAGYSCYCHSSSRLSLGVEVAGADLGKSPSRAAQEILEATTSVRVRDASRILVPACAVWTFRVNKSWMLELVPMFKPDSEGVHTGGGVGGALSGAEYGDVVSVRDIVERCDNCLRSACDY
jgi:hypothetical protein